TDDSTQTGETRTAPVNGRSGGGHKKPAGANPSGKLYILQNGKLQAVPVRVGITDGRVTEIKSDTLKEGDRVVVGELGGGDQQSSGTMRFRMF
ncbi:MAG TPA: efflux RND transporter periplasmic adaptor subunit, partial [Methylophilaceae bacterium]|nr:efflux RND transporter periplasmic adaptor subunit [Methylophilaceae bacterium]